MAFKGHVSFWHNQRLVRTGYLIRQDIANWHKSKCGLLVVDPHGSLYDGLINWIAWHPEELKKVPIVPIDLRQKDWTVAYNVMRERSSADPSVIVTNFVQAMAYVWGVAGTDQTPLFNRVGSNVLWTLYENGLTLLAAEYLLDYSNKLLRARMAEQLSKYSVAVDVRASNTMSHRDYDAMYWRTTWLK